MKTTFRQIRREDFQNIHNLALKGWYFAYSHLRKKELKNLVDKYYSAHALEKSLEAVKDGSQYFVLAIKGRNLVGFCSVALRGKQGELCNLYIDPELIGKGLGKKLLFSGEKFLKFRKSEKYFTFVNRHNKTGVNFYLRNGFVHITKLDKDDEFEPKVLWYMEKRLE